MTEKPAWHYRHWTIVEVMELRSLARKDLTLEAIALKLGRTPVAVRSKAFLEGISLGPPNPGQPDHPHQKHWTLLEVMELRRLIAKETPMKFIAASLGRTVRAVRAKTCAEGLRRGQRGRRPSVRHKS